MRTGHQRTFLATTVAAMAAAALMGIFAVFVDLGDTGEKVLATTLMVAAMGVVSLASATAKAHERGLTANGHVGMWAAGLGLAGALILLWGEGSVGDWEWLARTAACLGVVAVAAPHSGLLAIARLRPHMEWTRLATYLAIGVLTVILLLVIVIDLNMGDAVVKAITVAAIIATFGTIAVPILHKISGLSTEKTRSTVPDETVSLVCPRCKTQLELPLGSDSDCPECELEFLIEVNEKRCTCGYPLYGLPTSVCPECGKSN